MEYATPSFEVTQADQLGRVAYIGYGWPDR